MAFDTSVHTDMTDYLVIDFETTGLSAGSGDRVCELGAVKLRGGAVIDTFATLVNPQRSISPGASAVNGITAAMVANAPTFGGIADRLCTMMDGSAVVAYNAPFDVSFLENELRLAGRPRLSCPVVDALAMARQLLPGLGRYPQENVARVVGIPFAVKHRALEDAMVTAQLFVVFVSMLKACDCSTLADLMRRDLHTSLHEKRLSIVRNALATKTDLWVKYLSPAGGPISDSIISPSEYVDAGKGQKTVGFLIAFCHATKREKHFQIGQMLDVRPVPHPKV